jgi:hypothetical protein
LTTGLDEGALELCHYFLDSARVRTYLASVQSEWIPESDGAD